MQNKLVQPPQPLHAPLKRGDKRLRFLLVLVSFVGDFAMIVLGLIIGFWLRFGSGIFDFDEALINIKSVDQPDGIVGYLNLIVFGSFLLIGTFLSMALYEISNLLKPRQIFVIVTRSITLWIGVYLGLSLVLKFHPPISRIYVACSAIAVGMSVLFWRFVYIKILAHNNIISALKKRAAFVGWNDSIGQIINAYNVNPDNQFVLVGLVLNESNQGNFDSATQLQLLGTIDELGTIIRQHAIEVIICADRKNEINKMIQICNLCDREMAEFKIIPNRFHLMFAGMSMETISGVPVIGVSRSPLDSPVNQFVKRVIDIIGSIVGLAISLPLFTIFGTLVYLESPGPVIYEQIRVGRSGKRFKIYKIRSMRLDAETIGGAQWARENDARRLKVGSFMRATNIDEIPQFWNVLRGDMSLVGPRPERPELIERFQDEIPHYNARHTVKPGMTGWAQINGLRGNTDITERVKYDLMYIEKWTLWGDLLIMAMTFRKGRNAY